MSRMIKEPEDIPEIESCDTCGKYCDSRDINLCEFDFLPEYFNNYLCLTCMSDARKLNDAIEDQAFKYELYSSYNWDK